MDQRYRRMLRGMKVREESRPAYAAGPWLLYILRCGDGSLYTGITTDIERRVREHQEGKAARYTRAHRPVELVYSEECEGRSAALSRECAVKSLGRRGQGNADSRPAPGRKEAEREALRTRTAWTWIVLGAAAFGLHLAAGRDSALVERLYSRGLFVGWRWLWDQTLGRSPIPWVYILTAALLIAAAVWLGRILAGRKTRIRGSRLKMIGRALLGVAAGAGAGVFFFYVLWGFNYDRVGLEKQMGLEPPSLDEAALAAEASWASRMAAEARAVDFGLRP